MKKTLSLFILSGILVFLIVSVNGFSASASTIIDITESTTEESTAVSSGLSSSSSSANSGSSGSSGSSSNSGSNSSGSSGSSSSNNSGSSGSSGSSDGEIYIDDNGKLQVTSSITTEGLFTRIQNKLIEAFTGTRGIATVIICIIFVLDAIALAGSMLFSGGKRMGIFIAGLLVCLVAFVLAMYAPEISVAFSNWITTD